MTLQHPPSKVSQPSGQGFLPKVATALTKPHQRIQKRRGTFTLSLTVTKRLAENEEIPSNTGRSYDGEAMMKRVSFEERRKEESLPATKELTA